MPRRNPMSVILLASTLGLACASHPKVLQPPALDLRGYPTVGLLQFGSPQAAPDLQAYATQQFIQQVQAAQPGVRILELGPEPVALASVGMPAMSAEAVRAIAQRNNVQAVFVGSIDVPEAKPQLEVSPLQAAIGVSLQVHVVLGARLYDAGGATVWTDSSGRHEQAGGVGLAPGALGVSVQDPNGIAARLVHHCAYDVTDVFRAHWVRQ